MLVCLFVAFLPEAERVLFLVVRFELCLGCMVRFELCLVFVFWCKVLLICVVELCMEPPCAMM